MRNFRCECGQTLFFENTTCLACGKRVGFDPAAMDMRVLGESNSDLAAAGLCRNGIDYDVCNWVVESPEHDYCLSCRLNQTIPDLLMPERRQWWKSLEHAKRRLIYSLLKLKLPITGRDQSPSGLAFEFIEDKRSNPGVMEDHVSTGHLNGLITINITEADHVRREISRQYHGELYRTLLGHFRHESGHYYFERLVIGSDHLQEFRELFGDERRDYKAALDKYYAHMPNLERDPELISHYAQSHPLEDWAEVWAHYLHMYDTLETAGDYGLRQGAAGPKDFDEMASRWAELSMVLNSLNRSMGLEDAYPFVHSSLTLKKLRFVHGLIDPS